MQFYVTQDSGSKIDKNCFKNDKGHSNESWVTGNGTGTALSRRLGPKKMTGQEP